MKRPAIFRGISTVLALIALTVLCWYLLRADGDAVRAGRSPDQKVHPKATPSSAENHKVERRPARIDPKNRHPDRNPSVLPGNPLADDNDAFPNVHILAQRESEPANRTVTRVTLVSADMKYPLLRVEETINGGRAARRQTASQRVAMVADHILVQLRPNVTEEDLVELNAKHGAGIRKKMHRPGMYLVEFENAGLDTVPEKIEAYQKDADLISYAEPDYVVYTLQRYPNDPSFSELWGMHNTGQSGGTADIDIDAPEAWQLTIGNNVIVGVIDTGVDYLHEDLAANMWVNPGEIAGNGIDDDGNGYIDDIHGIDVINSDTDPKDDHDHGTHVSGTIAGVGDNGIGVAGVCWSARIMALKFLSAGGSGYISDAIECVDYAVMMGARVLNNSWGGGGYSQAMSDSIASANLSNVLFCAAAGNSAVDNDTFPHYPSSYTNANVLSVAAHDRNDDLSYFSCYGATSVDLAAPGSAILSAVADDGYASWNGTSMATPHVAGAAALLLSMNSQLGVAKLKAALMNSVDPGAEYAGKMVSNGRLNVASALQLVYGISFGADRYFADSWAEIRLLDNALAGTGTQVVTLASSAGDVETIELIATGAGGHEFTNSIWIAYGPPTQTNGSLEGVHGTELYAMYFSPSAGSVVTGKTLVHLGLDIKITTPPTDVPYSTTNFQVVGVNNGNVLVDMIASNEATGESLSFTATNSWTAPILALATNRGVNVIWVSGTNIYGYADSDSVMITRLSPGSATNYVAKTGTHEWPFLTWATASTNFSMAIHVAATGNVVLVGDDTYSGTEIVVDKPVTLRSANGPAAAIIDGQNVRRCLSILSAAVVDGFTLTGGYEEMGGAVYMRDGELRNCVVVSNEASDYGGGIYVELNGLITDCFIGWNTAYDGGGIEFDYAGVVSNSTIIGNYAYGYGGGVDCYGYGKVYNCMVTSNYADWYGGGIECWNEAQIYGSTITDNYADGDGGGIECYYGTNITVNNCLIAGNGAWGYGGGVDCWVGGILKNCTVIDNTANYGGGLYYYYGGDIQNTIIYYNSAPSGANYYNEEPPFSYEYSCTVPLVAGSGNITNNPNLIGMRNPHLLIGSPCIDAGTNAYAVGTDIDGEVRIANGTVDIGCDEWVAGGLTGALQVAILLESTNIAANYVTELTSDIRGRTVSYVWDFGGVTFTNTPVVSYSWAATGSHSVVLTAYNNDFPGGVAATTSIQIVSGVSYVSLTGSNVAPYSSWANAALIIQDAIDVLPFGGTATVTDGLYNVGGYIKYGATNRIGIYKSVTVRSVNGPESTFIEGVGPLGGSAVRCAYLVDGAFLTGFTLTNGHSKSVGSSTTVRTGGGVFFDRGGIVSNCVIAGNEAYYRGGGAFFYYGGTVVDCVVSNNTVTSYGGGACLYYGGSIKASTIANNHSKNYAGGVYGYYGGTVERCTIANNTAISYGGGIMGYSGTTFNNSLLHGNSAGNRGGGAYLSFGGEINNCTIVDNIAAYGGGVYCYYYGSVRNSIIYYNSANNGANYYDYGIGYTYAHNCTIPAVTGANNITNSPMVTSMANPHILSASPCINAGTNTYATGSDIDGETRISNGTVDIGCDEFVVGAITGVLQVAIWADATKVATNYPVELRSDISGRVLSYVWDFGGTTFTNVPVLIYSWSAPGNYDVVLRAYNDDYPGGVASTSTIQVTTGNSYVSLSGGNVPPYDSWATAALNIQDAVDTAVLGGTVIVTDGVYNVNGYVVDGTSNRVAILRPLTVRSVNGPASTTIEGAGPLGNGAVRCAYLVDGAVLSGFTLSNGHTPWVGDYLTVRCGGGAYLDKGGVLSNCVISASEASYRGGGAYCYYGGTIVDSTMSNNLAKIHGGGVAMYYGGSVSRCNIVTNSARSAGGGAYGYYGGEVSHCVIEKNHTDYDGGGVMLYRDSSVNNSLIRNNTAGDEGGGLFLYYGGDVDLCTIEGNSADIAGGVLFQYGGTVRGSIIYFNAASTGPNYLSYGSGGKCEYSCTTPLAGLPGGTGCIESDPLFAGLGDDRLRPGSPCIDTGTNAVAITTDLDGAAREIDGDTNGTAIVDMGAYEFLDTDGDGIPDYWEIANSLNHLVSDSGNDPDSDGLTNLQEYQYLTNPNNTDTDGDGYSDGVELLVGTDPLDSVSQPSVALTITGPTANATYSTTGSVVNLSGVLVDPLAVTNLVIENNRAIALYTVPAATNWSYINLPLYSGDNYITVTARDAAGKVLTDTITINYTGDSRYTDVLFSGALVQEINFPLTMTPGDTVTVQWKTLSYMPLRARLGTGSQSAGWIIYKNAQYTGSSNSSWNVGGRQAIVYSYETDYVVPTNTGDFSAWFNHAQMDGGLYMAAVVPDGVDPRPNLVQSKLITRTILAGGVDLDPQSDPSYTDLVHPFEMTQQSWMRSGGTIIKVVLPAGPWSVGSTVTCDWTVLSYVPVFSKLRLINLGQQKVWLAATGTQIGVRNSSWHIGSTYAKEYTFRGSFMVPNHVGDQEVYFLNAMQGVDGSSWMAGNIPAGVDSRPVSYNGMYGRFVERTIVP